MADTFLRFDNLGSDPSVSIVGAYQGAKSNNAEALAIRPGSADPIWAWDPDIGLFTIDARSAKIRKAPFDLRLDVVAGLTWANTDDRDLSNDMLYAITRSGQIVGYNEDGIPVDTLRNPTTPAHDYGDDIAWDSATGQFIVLLTNDLDNPRLTVIGNGLSAAAEHDTEGLGYGPDGSLWATTGDDGSNALYSINPETLAASLVLNIGPGTGANDVEAIDCLNLTFD